MTRKRKNLLTAVLLLALSTLVASLFRDSPVLQAFVEQSEESLAYKSRRISPRRPVSAGKLAEAAQALKIPKRVLERTYAKVKAGARVRSWRRPSLPKYLAPSRDCSCGQCFSSQWLGKNNIDAFVSFSPIEYLDEERAFFFVRYDRFKVNLNELDLVSMRVGETGWVIEGRYPLIEWRPRKPAKD